MFLSAILAGVAATSTAAVPGLPPAPPTADRRVVVGRSVLGRPIRATLVGSPRARVKLMVVGAVHGNEPAGMQVTARLRRARPPRGTAIWIVDDANPDGSAAGARQNAHGVDLNRRSTARVASPTPRNTAGKTGPPRKPHPRLIA